MNIQQVEAFITANIAEYWEALDWQFPNLGPAPRFQLNNSDSNTAGFAYYKGHVEFNLTYFCTHHNLEDLQEVIAHELSHIVQYKKYPKAKQAHGPEFRSILQSLGFSGRTYHSMQQKASKAEISAMLSQVEI